MKPQKLVYLLLAIVIASCSQTEDLSENLVGEDAFTRAGTAYEVSGYVSSVDQRKKIAEWLASNYSLEDAKRIHRAVTKASSLGLDEIFYLKEYCSKDTLHHKISCETATPISSRFAETCISDNEVPAGKAYNLEKIIINDFIQIYWPYSENWDGKSAPIIVFAPEDLTDQYAVGYKICKDGNDLETAIVDEKFCTQNPVWIINENATSYEDLPYLIRGERISKNGILYGGYTPHINLDSIKYETEEPIMTLKLGKVKATVNHDTWIAGGSEYCFKFCSLSNARLTCEADTSKCSQVLSKTKVYFKRKEISQEVVKELNAVAVSDWPSNLKNVVLKVVEEDPGKQNKKFEAELSVTWKSKTFGFNVSLPYGNNDDDIAERIYSRSFIRSTNNHPQQDVWEWDTSNGLYWTLPYSLGVPSEDKFIETY